LLKEGMCVAQVKSMLVDYLTSFELIENHEREQGRYNPSDFKMSAGNMNIIYEFENVDFNRDCTIVENFEKIISSKNLRHIFDS
jgi:hypothetical protein